jgi:16S rRNA (adenine1518-N6/adenine1519-N6)-dimethyltransferase
VVITGRQAADLLARHGVTPSRALGQNFVVDPNTIRRIARLSGVGPGDEVVEVGPGLGSLTLALADTGARVTAIEADRHLMPVLAEVLGDRADVRMIHGDARAIDWSALLGERSASLVANLPYNIATPLIADLLDDVPLIERMLVMVQREVGERLAASPGSKAYGAVSVKVAYWAYAQVVGIVPPTVFHPRPNVDSALVSIVRRATPAAPDLDAGALFELVRTAFGQRRKMLRSTLGGIVPAPAFERAGIAPTTRPEELGVDAWIALARAAKLTT